MDKTNFNALVQSIEWSLHLRYKNRFSVIESDLCANVRFFALMNVSSRCWSPFDANDCVFSRNEQQKVYYKTKQAYSFCG